MSETFAERLIRLRHAAGLTQRNVAERCGCSNVAVAHWELARNKPSYERQQKVANALGVSLEMLRNGRELPQLAALLRAIQIGSSREQLLAMMLRDA